MGDFGRDAAAIVDVHGDVASLPDVAGPTDVSSVSGWPRGQAGSGQGVKDVGDCVGRGLDDEPATIPGRAPR